MTMRSKTFAAKLLWLFSGTVLVCWLISSVLLGSILSGYSNQVRVNQRKWLNLYTRTFIGDLRVGNTLSIRNKMKMLLDSESYLLVRLRMENEQFTERAATSTVPRNVSWMESKFLEFLEPPRFSIPLQDSFQVKWGELEVVADPRVFYQGVATTISTYILAHLGLLLIFLGLLILVLRRQIQPLQLLTRSVSFFANSDRGSPEDLERVLKKPVPGASEELVVLKSALEKAVGKLLLAQNHLNEQKVQTELTKIALQVAHDIRSPLSVLKMMTQEISRSVSPDQLSLVGGAIEQIQSIAEDLLSRYRKAKVKGPAPEANFLPQGGTEGVALGVGVAPLSVTGGVAVELVAKHVESCVNTARLEMLGRKEFTLFVSYSENARWAFGAIEPVRFKRSLCNLLKNALEAIPHHGHVQVHVSSSPAHTEICIEDNGPGFAQNVIPALQSGSPISTKTEGHGLGLQFAKEALESMGGSLTIERAPGGGARLLVRLPFLGLPKGITPHVDVAQRSSVVVVDDDLAMHAYWKERLKHPDTRFQGDVHCFAKPGELFRWMSAVGAAARDSFFLIDLELGDPHYDGIGILKQLDLWQNGILVSAREERLGPLASEYEHLGIRMLPKSLLSWVPIHC